MKKKHIVVVTEGIFPDSYGGAHKVAYYVSKYINKLGYKVSIITRSDKVINQYEKEEVTDNFTIFRYKNNKYLWFNYSGSHVMNVINLNKEHFNDIYAFYFHYPYAVKSIKSKYKNKVIILQIHSPLLEEGMINRGKKYYLPLKLVEMLYEKSAITCSDKIIVFSDYLSSLLYKKYGKLLHDKVEKVHSGVDLDSINIISENIDKNKIRDSYGIKPNEIIVLCSRRHVNRTGVLELAKAISEEKYNNIKFIITGSGYLTPIIKNLLESNNNVVMTGDLKEDELHKIYSIADYTFIPTKELECFGLSTIESLYHGTQVIVSDSSANPEVINDVGGGIVVEFGIGSFKNVLKKLDNGSLKFSNNINFEKLKKYTYLQQAIEVTEIIDRLANDRV